VKLGMGGSSNELIFTRFLQNIYNFNDGDVIFFNFSFFIRGTYYDKDKKEILSSNFFINETLKKYRKIDLVGIEYVMDVFNYIIHCSEDYNRKVFDKFNVVFELLVKRNISIYYIFNENSEFSNDLLDYGTNIKFPTGFCNWLHENDYNREEECHYTQGIQPILFNKIKDILN